MMCCQPVERWSARDGWQPAWRGATPAIMQTGDYLPVAEAQVPALQAELTAEAALYP